ncbi:uncharacterized protein LOC128391871 [Panonychus citri]|uniref:uncharacterized protein LOC128391871 n=1 Tax=Panonychus citri TaxID=50023 RepID=UPI002307464D|nr:uncharacterized protein LOC128391871 [Panonychus citri]
MGYDPSLFISKLDSELKCPICQGVVEKPVHGINCNHIYCSTCIRSWLRHSLTCPLDRCSLNESLLRPGPRIIVSLVKNLEIRCSNYMHGCCWTMKLCELDQHLTWCSFKVSTNGDNINNLLFGTNGQSSHGSIVVDSNHCSSSITTTTTTSSSSSSSTPTTLCSPPNPINEIRQLRNICDKRSELKELRDLVNQLTCDMETITASGEIITQRVKEISENTDCVLRYLQYAQSQMMRIFLSREEHEQLMSNLKLDNSLVNCTVLNLSEFMTPEILMEYLRQNGMKPIKCVMGPYSFNRSRNFCVTVRLSDLDKLLDANLWPIGAALTITNGRNKSPVITGKRSKNTSTLCLESGISE